MEQLYRTAVEPALLGQQTSAPSLLDVLRRVPKTDFHCHLNGSITPGLLAHMERLLLHERRRCNAGEHEAEEGDEAEEGHMLFFNSQEKRMRNVLASPTAQEAASAPLGASASHSSPKDRMHYCFTVFDAIYRIMTNLAFTRLAVQDMMLCSAAENITVMEIRTSLRDGLQRTFRRQKGESNERETTPAKEEEEAAPVTKQMYVDVVIETAEHLLSGGLVDLESGELLSLADTAAILAHARCTGEEASEGAAARWWRVYDRVYAPLFPAQAASPSSSFPLPDAELVTRRQWCVSVLLPTLCHRMHVRLLLSINRGADVAAAWEAARLTTATQQRQIRSFHTWCCALQREPSAAVMARLRQTCWVTGMDLSGNCYKGDYATFNAALAAARSGSAASANAIRTTAAVTIHGGEKQDATELSAMVAFGPERWGHLVFTDDANLSVILAAQQGIELCLTSNLLTSGHADVAEHHLGHLLELWNSMAESGQAGAAAVAASTRGCYGLTENARLAARFAFVARRFGVTAAAKSGADTTNKNSCGSVADKEHSYVLPNLSFHTDDRGVFGTTLSDELLLASQHPGVADMAAHLTGDATVSTAVGGARFFWHLERLSLLQIFELPLPVQLLATLLTHNNDDEAKGEEAGTPRAVLRERCAECVAAVSADPASGVEWREWDAFVQLCARASAAATATGMAVPAALSAWEWAWLTDAFDHYYA